MLGRPFRVDWHPQDTPEALKAAYRAERDSVLQDPASRAVAVEVETSDS